MSHTNLRMDNTTRAFFALIRAGLWEQEVQLLSYGDIDYCRLFELAQEQSVIGHVAAGIEHVSDVKVPTAITLQFVGTTLQIEQQNKAMNDFVARLIEQLKERDINAILVKGQGVAQCYERPLWRSSGDIDLLLNVNDLFFI